jgi:2-amino-4-hydroxy-6-hydroxymethyldihydropteridine diphosphokinase
MSTPVWIGLGSNLGDRQGTLDAAVAALADAPGVAVEAVSSYHQTRPVGGPPGQASFLNAAARLTTALAPLELLKITQGIEDRLGRVRAVRWGERTLDIDLLIHGSASIETVELKLPHPRLAFRRFVLGPLSEIAPTIVEPGSGRTIADLLVNLDRRPRLVAMDGFSGLTRSTVFRRLVEELPAIGIEGVAEIPAAGRWAQAGPGVIRPALAGESDAVPPDHPGDLILTPWLVADFSLGPGWLRRVPEAGPRAFPGIPHSDPMARSARNRAGKIGIRGAEQHALLPLLVVLPPGPSATRRRPALRGVPPLQPESDDPDAIVAEVLATCRAIAET